MSILRNVRSLVSSLFKKGEKNNGVVIKEVTPLKNKKAGYKGKKKDAILPAAPEKTSKNHLKKDKNKNNNIKTATQKEVRPKTEYHPKEDTGNVPLIENFIAEQWETVAPDIVEGKTRFCDLNLSNQILRGVNDAGFGYCTDIQQEILPHSLKGIDVIGKAQTGTGKTAAFLLTILQRLASKPTKQRAYSSPRALIMAPTRELALQIEKDALVLGAHTGARVLSVFGGMGYSKQMDALVNKYIDIVIATPGRILDYYKQKIIKLDKVEILVLDEADRMLDMGFLPDMRRIINATPPKESRQTMMFSATLSTDIIRLTSMWTNEPVKVDIEPEHVASINIEQIAYIVTQKDKFALLLNLLNKNSGRAIIFANRRDQVKKLADKLEKYGISCGVLTGDVGQVKRIKTLENFRSGKVRVMVATDVAGRGIHVDDVEAVYNYTLPNFPDDYVHRIGRTGRAGAQGLSISFATEEDSYMLPQIEEHLKQKLKYISPDDELVTLPNRG